LGIVAFAAYSFWQTTLKSEVNIILSFFLLAVAQNLILRSRYAFLFYDIAKAALLVLQQEEDN
jgi:hypothetical protein